MVDDDDDDVDESHAFAKGSVGAGPCTNTI